MSFKPRLGLHWLALLASVSAAPAYAGNVSVLHAFSDTPDGSGPTASLTPLDGKLYGTTLYGGAAGQGSVFEIGPDGREKIVYSFHGADDGGVPQAALVAVGGTLYGTASVGGTSNNGVVYSVTPAGTEHVLHAFDGTHGRLPLAGLLHSGTIFYGTTAAGGNPSCNGGGGCGVVFSINSAGQYAIVAKFSNQSGWFSTASLIPLAGKFYGTTQSGGARKDGTVFSVTPAGRLKVIFPFQGGTDGSTPAGSLAVVGSMLYGTTLFGGADNFGTVFSLTLAGAERTLHSFTAGKDGAQPSSTLVPLGQRLYGTTTAGGKNYAGTIFSTTLNGQEAVTPLTGATTGSTPDAGLTLMNGLLFGTAFSGGGSGCKRYGCGAVFSFQP